MNGEAEENDIFRDLHLSEILNSVTDETPYRLWFSEHVKKLHQMVTAGLIIIGVYAY